MIRNYFHDGFSYKEMQILICLNHNIVLRQCTEFHMKCIWYWTTNNAYMSSLPRVHVDLKCNLEVVLKFMTQQNNENGSGQMNDKLMI